jgi:hypothetical protein
MHDFFHKLLLMAGIFAAVLGRVAIQAILPGF